MGKNYIILKYGANNLNRVIFHIDVNNAFLSWTAVKMLQEGKKIDIRTIPSVIGGNEATRHGIVLAKSPIAKKFGIKTAIPIYQAKQLCPWLEVYQGDFNTYREYSNNLYNLFLSYTPYVQRFSIDESFLDMTRVFSKIEEDLSKDYSEEKGRAFPAHIITKIRSPGRFARRSFFMPFFNPCRA